MKRKKIIAVLLAVCLAAVLFSACSDNQPNNPPAKDTFTISFVTATDEQIAPITAKSGAALNKLPTPQRDGYRFDGWFVNGEAFAPEVMPARDVTATAAWTKLYTLSFETGDGKTPVDTRQLTEGSLIVMPEEPRRENYKFRGWFVGGEEFSLTEMPARDVAVTAVWTKLYTLSFVLNGGTAQIDPRQLTAGSPIVLPENPRREHFKFVGWEDGCAEFTLTEMPERDLSLKAKWAAASTIKFDTGVTDLEIDPLVEVAGADINAPVTPVRAGYILSGWYLNGNLYNFTTMPAADIMLEAQWAKASNLPTVNINLTDKNGQTIPVISVDLENYVDSRITIQNTETDFALESAAASFRGRGNGSWTETDQYGKKGYRIKFKSKQALFGRKSSKHWVIIACTNFNDTTMAKNYLAYIMASDVFDGIEYSPFATWTDVYINGEYHGVYLFCEQVRVDKGRVDIKSEFGKLDTGYFVEYDAYAANEGREGINWFRINSGVKYPFTVKSPDPDDYLEEGLTEQEYRKQVSYIQDYVQKVYTAALTKNYATFTELADSDSFVDMYILHELFKNTDTGWSSFFLCKKPSGKLYAGPPWDFDATAGASRGDSSPDGIYVAGSVPNDTRSELYVALMQTPGFKNAVTARFKVLAPKITAFVNEKLSDDFITANKFAMGHNFVRWTPGGWSSLQTSCEANWERDTRALKNWLLTRTSRLSGEWK